MFANVVLSLDCICEAWKEIVVPDICACNPTG